MSPARAHTYLKGAALALFLLLAFGLAGNDDYAQAKAEEAAACKRNPAIEWCPK